MRLVWQVNEEWWGHNCVAYHGDYKCSIHVMDGKCFWHIDEDGQRIVKGTFRGSLSKAQKIVSGELRWLKLLRRIKNVASAA